jgi:hypothetical protein
MAIEDLERLSRQLYEHVSYARRHSTPSNDTQMTRTTWNGPLGHLIINLGNTEFKSSDWLHNIITY